MKGRQIYQPIAWDMPPTAEHDAPDSYVVTYWNEDWNSSQSNQTINTNGLKYKIVINLTQLNSTIKYKVWVSAKSSRGEGIHSEVLRLQYKGSFQNVNNHV